MCVCLVRQGPYNVIKNWDYCGFVRAMQNGEGKLWTAEVGGYRPGWGGVRAAWATQPWVRPLGLLPRLPGQAADRGGGWGTAGVGRSRLRVP